MKKQLQKNSGKVKFKQSSKKIYKKYRKYFGN